MRHRLVTAARQQTAGRRGRARAGGVPSHPRAHARPAGRSAPLGAQHGRERTQRSRTGGSGRGTSGGSDPSEGPCPPQRPPAQAYSTASPPPPHTEPSPAKPSPAPGSLSPRSPIPHKPQRTHRPRRSRGSSFPARATALYRGPGGANRRQSGPRQQPLTGGAPAALPSFSVAAPLSPAPLGVRMEPTEQSHGERQS